MVLFVRYFKSADKVVQNYNWITQSTSQATIMLYKSFQQIKIEVIFTILISRKTTAVRQ